MFTDLLLAEHNMEAKAIIEHFVIIYLIHFLENIHVTDETIGKSFLDNSCKHI
jgi:hypothetical protein